MIPTHRAKPNNEQMKIPVTGLETITGLLSSVLVVLVNTSGCVCLINSTPVIVFMVSISSFLRFGAKHCIRSTARNVPDSEIDSVLSPFSCTLSTEYNQRQFLLAGLQIPLRRKEGQRGKEATGAREDTGGGLPGVQCFPEVNRG